MNILNKQFVSIHLLIVAVLPFLILPLTASAQQFVHPGINQTSQDLTYMKSLVLKGEQPWKAAFERLKEETDTDFIVRPYAHVLRGPYGKPNIGGNELSQSANMAYNCAVLWYITGDKEYAKKAIEIIDAWSAVLWDFDYNDAKLLAAWTGHVFCNAAEILRYTKSGWQQKDIRRFSNMLMTVYYPLLRYYFPTANGNWDGAIIHTIMSIAIFEDNRLMFNNAVDHFLHGPVNESIFKYIYPNGQCQESMRDQGHVQLGLGEFAGAAQVAYTQGVDLYSIGNNRIALGYEYTAKFLIGETPYCYGKISERGKILRDDYEAVYRHYTTAGLQIPYIKMAADSIRPKASRKILTAIRAVITNAEPNSLKLKQSTIGYIAGAGASDTVKIPHDAIIITSGQSVQQALDSAAGTGRWVVAKAGLYTLPATLKIPSGVTLCGEGSGTVLFLDPVSGERDAIVNADDDLHDITIRNLIVEGATKPFPGTDPNSSRSFHSSGNRGGIIFRSEKVNEMDHLNFINLTVQNCTYNGVFISGAKDITFKSCNFNENGASVIPGPKLQHNLLLTHCTGITIENSRLVTSPFGSAVALEKCAGVSISNSEIARNAYYGILISECKDISVKGNLIEGNDKSGVMTEFLDQGSENITISDNLIQFNDGYGIESYSAGNMKVQNNILTGNDTYTGKINRNINDQQKMSEVRKVVMDNH